MITATIMSLGVATVILSVYAAFVFGGIKAKHDAEHVSKAICYQLFGEAVIGVGTLIFAIAAHFGWLDEWSQALQSSIRFCMFFATSATTYHLVKVVNKLKQ